MCHRVQPRSRVSSKTLLWSCCLVVTVVCLRPQPRRSWCPAGLRSGPVSRCSLLSCCLGTRPFWLVRPPYIVPRPARPRRMLSQHVPDCATPSNVVSTRPRLRQVNDLLQTEEGCYNTSQTVAQAPATLLLSRCVQIE